MTELKPCPFCGGKVDFNYNGSFEPDGIRCLKCRVILRFMRVRMQKNETFGECQSRMAEVWNRRVTAQTCTEDACPIDWVKEGNDG